MILDTMVKNELYERVGESDIEGKSGLPAVSNGDSGR